VTGPQYMCGQVSEQPSICVGRTNGQTVPAFTEPGQHINPALPKIMANRNESECIVVLLNREEYHRSTSRAAKFRKKSWNRTMRSKRLCASKDQTGSGEAAALEAPFRRDPAPMHLPDRRYLGLVGTVAAFGFASYVRECFSGELTLLMLTASSSSSCMVCSAMKFFQASPSAISHADMQKYALAT
jgi:hypothetical protein